MNLRGARVRDDPEINFIPLIDVLLVILVFFTRLARDIERLQGRAVAIVSGYSGKPLRRRRHDEVGGVEERGAERVARGVVTPQERADLDRALGPADPVDATDGLFATDNYRAGELIGQGAALPQRRGRLGLSGWA